MGALEAPKCHRTNVIQRDDSIHVGAFIIYLFRLVRLLPPVLTTQYTSLFYT